MVESVHETHIFLIFQKQLSDLRDGMGEYFAASEEILAALEKVKLANKLECGIDELSEKKMTCPKSKLGMVIGKNGSKIDDIQNTCKVSICVAMEEITIIGSELSIERAKEKFDNIIRAEEEEIELEKLLLDYLTSKYVPVIRELEEKYTSSFVDVSRSDGKLIIQGSPEDVAGIKAKIFGIRIISRKRLLNRKEVSSILGKRGITIERLCIEHMVPINISRDSDTESSAIFIGPPEMVEAAISDAEKLINEGREVEIVVNISVLQKFILLADGGHHINSIRSKLIEYLPDGQCFLILKSVKDRPSAVVMAKQLYVSDALQFVLNALKELDNLTVKRVIDPYIIPRIIGERGETIRKITGGKPYVLKVDKISGEVSYGATTAEGLEEIREKVDEIIDNNNVVRVKADSAILIRQYRELSRSLIKNEINGTCWFGFNMDDSCFVIRGKEKDLEKAKTILDDFILSNQFAELLIDDEDLEMLLNGGRNSKIKQFSEEMGVKLHVDRADCCLVVHGSREKVDESLKKLSRFLNGDDDFTVMKFNLSETVVGLVIGKGGKTRQQLEKKHGVIINISKSYVVTIRGPREVVTNCRIEIAKLVASATVCQSISISDEQKAALEQKEYTKKIHQQTRVNLTTTDGKIVVKGSFCDVRDTLSLLNEMLTGEYRTTVELDGPQFSKVRNTVRDPSHFDRIEFASGAKLDLDLSARSITIYGKRSHVKRAKDQVYSFLDFLFPNQLIRLKITKVLFTSVGKASVLAETSAEAAGVAIYLDRDLSLIVIRSIDEEKVRKATALVKEKINEAERLAYVFEISASDSWIIPAVIGKKGRTVSVLRKKYSRCKIDISKESRTISIVGESEEIVQEVREAFVAAIEKVRSENVFVTIQQSDIRSFLGKGGCHVKELSAKHGVVIQTVKKGNDTDTFRISGEMLQVKTVKEAIDTWLDMRGKANATLEMTLERDRDIVAIIGQKGAIARSIEEEYKCRIDVDKKSLVVTIRGPSERQREAALSRMKELIETHHKERTTGEVAAKEDSDNGDITSTQNSANVIGTIETESLSLSKSENADFDTYGLKDDNKRSQFPNKPVGVASKSSKNVQAKKKKVDTSVSEGTEAGQSLFAILTSED